MSQTEKAKTEQVNADTSQSCSSSSQSGDTAMKVQFRTQSESFRTAVDRGLRLGRAAGAAAAKKK